MNNTHSNKLDIFIKNAEATTATVQIVNNDASEISLALTKQNDSEKVLVAVKNINLIKTYLDSITPIFIPNNDEIVSVPLCITDALLGIAETGSVILSVDNDYSAYFSMLSKKHIVLLKVSDIYDRPRDLFDGRKLEIEKNKSFTFITGPSATADMGSLVHGVHGPEFLHIIVIKDEK
jgi:L-lactate utilization protein LutC